MPLTLAPMPGASFILVTLLLDQHHGALQSFRHASLSRAHAASCGRNLEQRPRSSLPTCLPSVQIELVLPVLQC